MPEPQPNQEAAPTSPLARPVVPPTPPQATPPSTPAPQAPVTPPAPPAAPKLSAIRTFRGDISTGVQTQNVTVTKIAVAEAERRRSNSQEEVGGSSGSRRFVMSSILLLLLLAGGSLFYFAFLPAPETKTAAAPPLPASIVFSEEIKVIDTNTVSSADALRTRIAAELTAASPKNGKVLSLVFTSGVGAETRVLDAQEFFGVMTPSMPANALRSLGSDFMFGVYFHQANEPFIIVEPLSYENAFAGMLKWEDSMATDLLPLFNRKGELSNTRTGTWSDTVIRNIDTRIEKDADGKTTLVYSFINRGTLIITGSETGFIEAVTRFHTPKPVTR